MKAFPFSMVLLSLGGGALNLWVGQPAFAAFLFGNAVLWIADDLITAIRERR